MRQELLRAENLNKSLTYPQAVNHHLAKIGLCLLVDGPWTSQIVAKEGSNKNNKRKIL